MTATTLIELYEHAATRGSAPFFSYIEDPAAEPVEHLDYAEFYRRAVLAAANLQARGVGVGDRVGLFALPRAEYVVALAGITLSGAVPAPINHHFKPRELAAYLAVLDPAALVVDTATSAVADEVMPSADRTPLLIGISGAPTRDLDLAEPGRTYRRPAIEPDDIGLVLHSSGTTGAPKAVLRSHGSVADFVAWFATYFDEDEHILSFLPLYHQAGLILSLLTSIALGVDFVQQARYSTSHFWRQVDRNSATHVNLMAPVPSYLLAQPASTRDRQHSLRWVVIAGRNDHWAAFQERFGVTGMTFYGSTETLQIASTGNPKRGPVPTDRLLRVGHGILTGRPISGRTDFRLVEDGGRQLIKANVEGQIEARGDFMFSGYLHDEQASKQAFTGDGWFRTGDIGYLTEDAQLVLIGRSGGMIRRSGENVAPREIEIVLEDHPDVQESIVIGVPDEFRGQEILARVVLKPRATVSAEQLYTYLEANLTPHKVPRYLIFHDSFERTPTFKIRTSMYTHRMPGETWLDRTRL